MKQVYEKYDALKVLAEIEKNGNTNFITDSGLKSGKQIFAVGDSHTIFFHNSLLVKEHWGFQGKIPLTMYTLLQEGLDVYNVGNLLGNGHEKYNIVEGDHVLFFYGYNDMLRNIHMHARDRWGSEIERLCTAYVNLLNSYKSTYKVNTIIVAIYPNPRPEAVGVNCQGSLSERVKYTEKANEILHRECNKYNLPILDIYELICDPEGMIKQEYTADGIHLDYNNLELRMLVEGQILSACDK
jgi:lysophospholipase L1-like esterase